MHNDITACIGRFNTDTRAEERLANIKCIARFGRKRMIFFYLIFILKATVDESKHEIPVKTK